MCATTATFVCLVAGLGGLVGWFDDLRRPFSVVHHSSRKRGISRNKLNNCRHKVPGPYADLGNLCVVIIAVVNEYKSLPALGVAAVRPLQGDSASGLSVAVVNPGFLANAKMTK